MVDVGLHWIDGLIVAAYAGMLVGLGWHFSRRQQSTDEYFTGGRAMHPLLIGISLFVTLLSTISYLSGPGEIIKYGPYMLTGVLSIPFAYVIVGYVLIPVFMRYRLTSAYELLERKLGLSSRLTGATMFVVLRLMWMAVLLNFAANAVLVMLGLDGRWLFAVTLAIGSVALIYSTLGGLRAVVITDLLQFLLLFGGALLVIATVTVRLGGFHWIPTSWDSHWQSQPIFSLDPYVRLTVFGVVLMETLWWVCTVGGDQTAIQRFMATRDVAAARRSFLITSLASALVLVVLALVGLSLLAYFRVNADRLPEGKTIAGMADSLFPYFISHQLPVGISGLVVSGLFAAAMSSVDSGINSITAVVMTDFIDRFRGGSSHQSVQGQADGRGYEKSAPTPRDGQREDRTNAISANGERQHVKVAKLIALFVGLIVIGSSTLIQYVPGNLLEVSKRTIGLLMTPIATLFFMAIFVRFATAAGANVGSLCGFFAATLVSFWNPLVESRTLSITWITPSSLATGILVGCAVSLLTGRQKRVIA